MNNQGQDRTPDLPTDLDVVDDIGGSDADRSFDAELSRLLRASTSGSGGTTSVHDLTGIKERGLRRRRRRTHLRRTAAVAAAAAVVLATTAVVIHQGRPAPLPPAAGTSLPLLPDAPALSTAEEQRLQALPLTTQPLTRGENSLYWNGTFAGWTSEVDCSQATAWAGLRIPVLPGLDTSGYTQVCAIDDQRGLTGRSFTVSAGGEVPSLYRFYLPPGVDLSRVTPADAAAAGVSWTRITPATGEQSIAPRESAADLAADLTTITRTGGDLALVARNARGGTDMSWYERIGAGFVDASAAIAADPVTAVRATLDPHPCDSAFNMTPSGGFGGALTARGALQAWLAGDDAEDYPEGTGPEGAPASGWVVVDDREEYKTFASGDWRVSVSGHFPGTWTVVGKGCDVTTEPTAS